VPNCSLFLNSVKNQTKNVTNGSLSQFTVNLSDNTYSWNIACNDSDNSMGNSSLRSLVIDTTKPIFSSETFTNPVELGDNQTYSINITDTYLVYANFSYLSANYTLTNSSITFTRSFQTYQNGTNSFVTYAVDAAGNINSTSNNFDVQDTIAGPRIMNILYSSSIAQNGNQNVTAWILDSNPISAAYISIDGTNYTMTNATSYYFNYTFSATSCGSSSFKIFTNNTNNQGITNTTNFTITTCCGDGTCNNGETCSSCSRDCGVCATTPSGGGTGGGGGGTRTTSNKTTLAPATTTQTTETITEASPVKPIEIQLTNPDIPISNIFINVNNNLKNIQINVETLLEKPSDLSAPENTVYKYLKFTLANITDPDIDNAILSFSIPTSWFIEEQIDKTTITLNRFTSSWEVLPTVLTEETNETVYYTANTTGFSYFAITGKPITLPTPSEQITKEKEIHLLKIIIISIISLSILVGIILFLVREFKHPNV
jgi:PGF-pre-PGF domain-containing protein